MLLVSFVGLVDVECLNFPQTFLCNYFERRRHLLPSSCSVSVVAVYYNKRHRPTSCGDQRYPTRTGGRSNESETTTVLLDRYTPAPDCPTSQKKPDTVRPTSRHCAQIVRRYRLVRRFVERGIKSSSTDSNPTPRHHHYLSHQDPLHLRHPIPPFLFRAEPTNAIVLLDVSRPPPPLAQCVLPSPSCNSPLPPLGNGVESVRVWSEACSGPASGVFVKNSWFCTRRSELLYCARFEWPTTTRRLKTTNTQNLNRDFRPW
mmetsp:Transcript_18982/g.28871  ORF Transcript_18982/g.28871 Transcript_18982/m.28871 type:complete len:259 (+) Transcript_18982:303-1079(+)